MTRVGLAAGQVPAFLRLSHTVFDAFVLELGLDRTYIGPRMTTRRGARCRLGRSVRFRTTGGRPRPMVSSAEATPGHRDPGRRGRRSVGRPRAA